MHPVLSDGKQPCPTLGRSRLEAPLRNPIRNAFASVLLPALSVLAHAAAPASTTDPVWDGFREPPASVRPFVRWWWNGDKLAKDEILRELDVMKAAGIGGVEINSIKF